MVIAIIKKTHLLVKVGVTRLYSLIGESAPLWWGGIGSEPIEATIHLHSICKNCDLQYAWSVKIVHIMAYSYIG